MTWKHVVSGRVAFLRAVLLVGLGAGVLAACDLNQLIGLLSPVSSVVVNPATVSLVVGITQQLTATPEDGSGTPMSGRTVTWASANPAVATVDGSGWVKGTIPGQTTITATCEGKSGSANVTIMLVPVAAVSVTPASPTVQAGQTLQLTATPQDANGAPLSGRPVTWASSNTAFATVDASGLVKGVAPGQATITATSEAKSGSTTVTVSGVPVAAVSVTPASAGVLQGQTVQLTATPQDASGAPLPGRQVTWASSNTAVATVTSSGRVTGVAAGGPVTITATSEGKSGTSAITVTSVPVASVSVTPAAATVPAGQTGQLTATPRDANGNPLSGRTVTWSSSNTAAATVNNGGFVTGVAPGSATITATSEGKSGTAAITVITPPPPTACGATAPGVCYYVDAALGTDANPGTSAQPFGTISHAAGVVNPGDMVIVRNGVYTGSSTAVLTLGRGGTAANWVTFKAENKWGAVLDGQNNASSVAVQIDGSYTRLQGFEIRGSQHGVELATSVHDVAIAQNHIHDIGRLCTATTSGQSAIYTESSNVLVEQNLIHDTGRFSEGENGCSPGNTNWQNHDHGIYLKGTNVIVRNNVFYNILHGWAVHLYGASADQLSVVNNTFAFPNPNRAAQILIAEPLSNSVIANNIFYQPLTEGIRFDPADGGSTTNVTVANNITSSGPACADCGPGVTFSNNLDNTDPKLVSPSAFDFHLQAGSPAIGAGLSLSYVLNDFDGVSRTQGAPYDIGAYQFR